MKQLSEAILTTTAFVLLAVAINAQPMSSRDACARPGCSMAMPTDDMTAWLTPPDDSDMPIPPMGGAGGPGFGPEGGGPNRRNFEQFRLVKLLDVLDLKEEQETPFITAFRAMRREQREIEHREREMVEDISAEIKKEKPDEKKLNEQMDKLLSLDDSRRATMRTFLTKMRTTLTAVQTARLVIFQARFDIAALKMAHEFQRRGFGPGAEQRRNDHDSDGR